MTTHGGQHSLSIGSYARKYWSPGAGPIKILQRKFYSMQIFKHFDWLKKLSIQSKCFKK